MNDRNAAIREVCEAALDRAHGRINSDWQADVRDFRRILRLVSNPLADPDGRTEYDLWLAAITVANYPPDAPHADTFAALVPWSRIIALREALERCGIDWRGRS